MINVKNNKDYSKALKNAKNGETIIFNEHNFNCNCYKCNLIEKLIKQNNEVLK